MNSIEQVTIGIPVFNEGPFIDETIHSAASQCKTLLVSDNCSTDDSAVRCEVLSKLYSNMVFVKQARNIGALANFKYLLESADTPYFMWLGGHDVLSENYVSEMKKALDEGGRDCILAFASSIHIDAMGNSLHRYSYDYANLLENSDSGIRLMAILQHLSDCSLVHGLFRTAHLKQAWIDAPYIGSDHVLLARAVLIGRFKYLSNVEYIRRDPHVNDSLKNQLARIIGSDFGLPSDTYRNMQIEQYSLVSNYAEYEFLRALYFRLKARFWLLQRFGYFGESMTEKIVDKLILRFGRILLRLNI